MYFSSSSSLNNFVESFNAAVSALENLNIDDLKDFILLNLAMRKLDPITAQAFESHVRGYVQLCVSSKDKKYSYNIVALVLDKLTDRMPSEYIDSSVVQHLMDLPLADPLWHIPGEVELILGAKLFPHLLLGRKIMKPSAPSAIETVFGFILTGDVPNTTNKNNSAFPKLTTSTFFTCSSEGGLADRYDELLIDKNLTKFWEMEEMPSKGFLSPEEAQCEEIYSSTVTRDSDGRYCTALPFCRDPSELGDSRSVAVCRLYSLERKLQDPELRASFNEVIQDNAASGPLYDMTKKHLHGIRFFALLLMS
ncbi:putative peptidase (DUF1758) domain-containing protein [Phthorimaea operculella]|nr:putative peptidase (DUF1758) domain-containing protein [Phthorimaea operculella]